MDSKIEQLAGQGADVRRFSVSLTRTMTVEFFQFAEVEIEAASESEARKIAERIIARGDELEWEDADDVLDEDPDGAYVSEVDEIEDEDDDGEAEDDLRGGVE